MPGRRGGSPHGGRSWQACRACVRRPSLTEAIVKLNEGVSGSGNALVDLHGLPASGSPDEAAAIRSGCSACSWSRRS